jgi:FkbM family methyltransferase
MVNFSMKIFRKVRNALPFSLYRSQKGQDRWILSTLKYPKSGFFIELAAADGYTHSNTYVLEKKFGWQGICIEANPRLYKKLSNARSVQCINGVVDNEEKEVRFRIDNDLLGGIVDDDTDNSPNVRGDEFVSAEIVTLQTTTLTRLLDDLSAPRVIEYFSLDVEGAEQRVIEGIDFERYIFLTVTIERPTPTINQILKMKGYAFVKNVEFDSYYIHNTHPFFESVKKAKFEQVPTKTW